MSSRILLAVSGGVDSVVMLDAVRRQANRLKLSLFIGHIDHGLRTTSAADAKWVEFRSGELGIPFFSTALVPPKRKVDIEAWGRKERYSFLSKLAKKLDVDWILTAHTKSDVVETLLMQFFANREARGILAVDKHRSLIRPFLSISREEILKYAATRGLSWREDETNLDTKFLRNRIRHEFVPYLSSFFSTGVGSVLSEQANRLSLDYDFLDSAADRAAKQVSVHSNKVSCASVLKVVEASHPALQWRIIENVFLPLVSFRLGSRHSSRLVKFILQSGKSSGVTLQLPGGVSVSRTKGNLEVKLAKKCANR